MCDNGEPTGCNYKQGDGNVPIRAANSRGPGGPVHPIEDPLAPLQIENVLKETRPAALAPGPVPGL
jgi:hypothetical protein